MSGNPQPDFWLRDWGKRSVGLKERLHRSDHLAAGGLGFEHLPDKALESQAQREHPLPAVLALLFARQQLGRQEQA
jgi:hypothetical protein